jgi:hypothetical protein
VPRLVNGDHRVRIVIADYNSNRLSPDESKIARVPPSVEVFSERIFHNGFGFLTSRLEPAQSVLGVTR